MVQLRDGVEMRETIEERDEEDRSSTPRWCLQFRDAGGGFDSMMVSGREKAVRSDHAQWRREVVRRFRKVAITSGEGQFIEEVRQAQIGVDLLNLQTVDARGLPLEPDNLHLTTPAQVQLGEKLARAFLQFLPGQEQSNSGSLLVQSVAPNKLRKNCLYTTSLVALSSILIPLL